MRTVSVKFLGLGLRIGLRPSPKGLGLRLSPSPKGLELALGLSPSLQGLG